MNTRSVARISCERPLNLTVADRIESALIDPATDLLLIEFRGNPETEGAEVDQILAADPLIDRLRNLLREMEKGTKPVVALLSEPIGGLQFEIALACHVRFSSVETTILNFPWLKYGLMPILGGTQRLPRICGIELAARVLLQTGTLTGADAVASGLLEAKNGPLPEPAIEWAETHPRPMQPWDRLPQELSSTNSQAPSNRRLLEKIYLRLRNHVPPEEAAPAAILRCIYDGLERSIDAGIRVESEQWSLVRRSRSTLNRIKTLHIAKQKAIGRVTNQPEPIKRIGVLGAGLMGTGIAYTAARAGYIVQVVEISQEASDRSLQRMKRIAQQDANSGLFGEDALIDLLKRVHWASEVGALSGCDFIVEAIFERPALKMTQLAAIAALADQKATIASNTTTLPISDLASACKHPERFLGTHFFAPVDRMELLEIVAGEKTAPETINRALLFASTLRKAPIVVRDGPGFFTSRVVAAYLQEALFMIREGASPWMIDNVAQNAGMILGPLTMADLMPLDLLADIFESLAIYQRGSAKDAAESVKILKEFISRSRLGKKAGAGIYDYDALHQRADWPELGNLFAPAIYPPVPDEIESRLFVIQTIEALRAMREGIIGDAGMADLASVLGWSYPAGRGGVMGYIDFIGGAEFERVRSRLQEEFGDRFMMPG
jgi:3-hydroxyacyl-CoA dehydrogenase / enoyl-CoA hydratase / 3-hydroxybutyryl-CoA epimerase